MPRRLKPQSVFMALPHEMRQKIRSQPADVMDAHDEPSLLLPAHRLSSQESESPSTSTLAHSKVQLTMPAVASSSTIVRSKVRQQGWTPAPKKRRRDEDAHNPYTGHAWDCTGLVPRYLDVSEVPAELQKYWWQRHRLFPRYNDMPLLLDDVGWFSVTPHAIAAHIADRCRGDVVLDAFCGVGGNAIELARTCERVIAMDNNPIRLRLARHNALHCGVADRIEFVLADYISFARSYTASAIDVVFLSPPWGGPDYLASSAYYPLSALEPIPGDELFRITHAITPNIAYYLPRNVDVAEVGQLVPGEEWCEVEEEWVGDKLKAVTVYYGGLVSDVS